MEFEKNGPVSDEQRRLAETKKVTVQPVHTNVTPEDISDSEIANSHINGQPIANVNNDIEQDAPALRQGDTTALHKASSESRKQSAVMIMTIVGVASILIIASLFFVFNIIG